MVYSRWWAQRLANEQESLSILDLVNSGTVDCKLAGLLWLLMEHRPSLLVAAGPSWAGKTTLFHALLDFLPPDLERITLQGYYEDFQFLNYAQPSNSYLITEEISNHMYEYLWGPKAIKAFTLLSEGYTLGGTVHARTAEEAIYVLHQGLGLPVSLLSQLNVIVTLQARAGRSNDDEPIRRVNSVNLVLPADEGHLALHVLAAREFGQTSFEYQTEAALKESLEGKGMLGISSVYKEMEMREHYLKHLRKKGQTTRTEVRQAVLTYYRSKGESDTF